MLSYVKSQYILRMIFSLLEKKTKLKIIKYNKFPLQQKLEINIDDYKNLSSKYIIWDLEIRKKGKEYNKDKVLIYEGEFKNGERNGQGKEFFLNGNLLFNGNYLNGKRNGQGKEFYPNGNLLYEGDYMSGKRNNGNIYLTEGKTDKIIKGDGINKEFSENGDLLEGEYKDGKKQGKWVKYDINGEILIEGNYKNSKKNGIWIEFLPGRRKIIENYKDDIIDGQCSEFYEDNLIKEKFYKNGNLYKSIKYANHETNRCIYDNEECVIM